MIQLASREGNVSLQTLRWVSYVECESASPLDLTYGLRADRGVCVCVCVCLTGFDLGCARVELEAVWSTFPQCQHEQGSHEGQEDWIALMERAQFL